MVFVSDPDIVYIDDHLSLTTTLNSKKQIPWEGHHTDKEAEATQG